MTSPAPDPLNSDTDPALVDVEDVEVVPVRQQWRSMMPAALAGTAALLLLMFVVMPLLEKIKGVPDVVRLAATPLLHALIASYAIWVVWRHQQKLLERRLTLVNLLLEGIIAFGVWIGVMFANFAIGCLWMTFAGEPAEVPEEFQEIILSQNMFVLLFVAMLACLWAPVSEELFFRRMLLRSLQGRLPLWGALLIQAALFTALHSYYAGIQFAPLFVLGVALGGIYVWRRTILSSMFLHAMQNTFATTMMGVMMWASARAPVLGIEMESAHGDVKGAKVVHVIPNGPADKAGLQDGDVITGIRLSGMFSQPGVPYQPVPDAFTLRVLLMLQSAGNEVRLTVLRNGDTLDVPVTLGDRKDLEEEEEVDQDEDAGE